MVDKLAESDVVGSDMAMQSGPLRPSTTPLTPEQALARGHAAVERVDPKGKVFTPRVRTDHVEVEMITSQGRVHGYIHVMPGLRVKDLLNTPSEQFLAVTDALIGDGENAQHHEFITINKMYIYTVIPVNEARDHHPEEEYIAY